MARAGGRPRGSIAIGWWELDEARRDVACGCPVGAVAERYGVRERTMRRWLHDAALMRECDRRMSEVSVD